MILTDTITIFINESNYDKYSFMGYDTFCGDYLEIPVALLSDGSCRKILCKCDSCGIEKEVIYKNYIKYGNKFGEYLCRKCSESKRENSMINKYGAYSPNNAEFKRKKDQ